MFKSKKPAQASPENVRRLSVRYLGLGLFAFSTLVFRVPLSSPSRLAHYLPKMNKRLDGLLSSISIMIMFLLEEAERSLCLTVFLLGLERGIWKKLSWKSMIQTRTES